ncbi:MAG: hypothetical protein JWP81_1263 [Ferruginibacter sp.]|nr:hypothetical protein [Ferruginibacter sp.]
MNNKQSLTEQEALLKLIEEGKRLAAETLKIVYKDQDAARENLMKIQGFAKLVEETLKNTSPVNPSLVSVKILLELDDFSNRHLN